MTDADLRDWLATAPLADLTAASRGIRDARATSSTSSGLM